MHGRVNWTNFAWWYENKTPQMCRLCGTSTHATDVMTSLSQCTRIQETSIKALCAGYKALSPSVLQWAQTCNPLDRRNFTRNLIPDSLADHLLQHKQVPTFLKARKPSSYHYLRIMHTYTACPKTCSHTLTSPMIHMYVRNAPNHYIFVRIFIRACPSIVTTHEIEL